MKRRMTALLLLLLAFGTGVPEYAQGIECDTLNKEVTLPAGRFDDATVMTKKGLQVAEQAMAPNHPHVVVTLNSLTQRARAYRTASECPWAAEKPTAGLGDG
jgi:hypothetical protein